MLRFYVSFGLEGPATSPDNGLISFEHSAIVLRQCIDDGRAVEVSYTNSLACLFLRGCCVVLGCNVQLLYVQGPDTLS